VKPGSPAAAGGGVSKALAVGFNLVKTLDPTETENPLVERKWGRGKKKMGFGRRGRGGEGAEVPVLLLPLRGTPPRREILMRGGRRRGEEEDGASSKSNPLNQYLEE